MVKQIFKKEGWTIIKSNLCKADKKGFTLAEVLITLAIIGVVAAMSMPTLLANVQKAIAITQIKRTFAILSNTTYMAEADYGAASGWEMKNGNTRDGAKFFAERYIIPYVRTAKICTDNNNADCDYTIRGLNNATINMYKNQTYRFYLVDGSFVILWANQNMGSSGHRKQVTIYFDINSKKGANSVGHDVFKLEYILNSGTKPKQYVGKILPAYVEYNRDTLLTARNEGCHKNKEGIACLAVIYNDGWVFAKDYPW